MKNVGNQTVAGRHRPPQFGKKKYYGSQWLPATVWLPTFPKIPCVFNKRRKSMQEGEQNKMNDPFKAYTRY